MTGKGKTAKGHLSIHEIEKSSLELQKGIGLKSNN